jgi:glycosyltransferase involved in cell wall biosynthesis
VKLAIVHDYLIQMGGAERVVAAMAEAFPEAPIYTSVTDHDHLLPEFLGKDIRNNWINRLPGSRRHFKKLFPLYPFAFRSMSRVDADIVWISSSGFAKWIRVADSAKTICYCYTPPRFFWSPDTYMNREFRGAVLKTAATLLLTALRSWDFQCAQRIDRFVAISRCVQQRILDCYGRSSVVVYPPVNVDRFTATSRRGEYYVILARLVGYKRIDLAVQAFNRLNQKLVVIGDGPDRARLEAMAGPTITFAGRVKDAEAKSLLQGCRGLIFPGVEDFGIAPVEAQACGRPVIAFAGGGALETIIDGETGNFFDQQSPESLAAAVRQAESIRWNPEVIRAHAEKFSNQVFLGRMKEVLEASLRSRSEVAAPGVENVLFAG